VAAGYGAGKTLGACAKAFQLAVLNQGFIGCVLEPTGPMLRDIWIRKFDDFLDHYGIPYTFRATPLPEHVLHLPEGDTPVVARSFENYKRIVGPDWAWALIDEVDTVQEYIAARCYEKILGRIRVAQVSARKTTRTCPKPISTTCAPATPGQCLWPTWMASTST